MGAYARVASGVAATKDGKAARPSIRLAHLLGAPTALTSGPSEVAVAAVATLGPPAKTSSVRGREAARYRGPSRGEGRAGPTGPFEGNASTPLVGLDLGQEVITARPPSLSARPAEARPLDARKPTPPKEATAPRARVPLTAGRVDEEVTGARRRAAACARPPCANAPFVAVSVEVVTA